jgi:hypothetical protein
MSLSILSEATATQNKAKARALRAGVELVDYNGAEVFDEVLARDEIGSVPQSENIVLKIKTSIVCSLPEAGDENSRLETARLLSERICCGVL